MIIEVIEYNLLLNVHKCKLPDGTHMFIDCFVDGGLPDGLTNEAIEGRKIECSEIQAFIGIAVGPKLIDEKKAHGKTSKVKR